MVMKSGARPLVAMARARSCQNDSSPTADLMPTGRPVASASCSMKSSRLLTSWNVLCAAGLMQSWPIGMPRMRAISAVTFAAGSTPPRPGLAPCDSLISSARTGAVATVSSSRSSENPPLASRQPK